MAENIETESKYRSIPIKEQMSILKRILKFTKPYAKQFIIAIVLVLFLAIVNALQPRVIQLFIDNYLNTGLATSSTVLTFGAMYF